MENPLQDRHYLELLRNGDSKALDFFFRAHYRSMYFAVTRILPDEHLAEDLVQDVFLDIWRKRQQLSIEQGMGAYLRRAAINKTLNYIRDNKIHLYNDEAALLDVANDQNPQVTLEQQDMQKAVNEAVDRLPERCRMVFSLSRFELLSNQDIANELGISVKTVENQMTKALKLLRDYLAPVWHLLQVFCLWVWGGG